ncbi:hypothetical protein GCM10022256_26760 [Frondihabitans peucedani]|uniref:Lipoprotein n=2 Tax=Frondihabitans peucedani TaxID=598626 RepID=A0ABP8E4C8_9MICO
MLRHHVHMTRMLTRSMAALLTGLVVVATAGCTGTVTQDRGEDAWTHRMEVLLSDPHGDGGASATLTSESGTKTASALVELSTVDPGRFDVLSVCRGSGVVRVSVLHRSPENNSGTFKPLTSRNVVCGATTRLPITIPSHDVVLKATGPTGSDWVAEIVTRGWEPQPDSVE